MRSGLPSSPGGARYRRASEALLRDLKGRPRPSVVQRLAKYPRLLSLFTYSDRLRLLEGLTRPEPSPVERPSSVIVTKVSSPPPARTTARAAGRRLSVALRVLGAAAVVAIFAGAAWLAVPYVVAFLSVVLKPALAILGVVAAVSALVYLAVKIDLLRVVVPVVMVSVFLGLFVFVMREARIPEQTPASVHEFGRSILAPSTSRR